MSVPRLLRRWLGLRCLLRLCPCVTFRGPDGAGLWAVCVDCGAPRVHLTGPRADRPTPQAVLSEWRAMDRRARERIRRARAEVDGRLSHHRSEGRPRP